jgi:pyridoxine 4-dehydrogenase
VTLELGDRQLTRIGLGTNRLSYSPEHASFIHQAVEAGINHIDTAYSYVGGESERTIGAALQGGAAAVVATKGGAPSGNSRPETLRAEIEESHWRLRTETIPLYYLHRVHPETPLEESLGAIKEYRDRGAIEHIGLSEVNVEQIERAREVVPIAAVQNHYNLSERKHEPVVDHCADQGLIFVPYFPLRGDGGPALAGIAERRGATEAQIALAWLLRRSPTTLPIPGTLSIDHVRENLSALEIELTDDEYEALLEV